MQGEFHCKAYAIAVTAFTSFISGRTRRHSSEVSGAESNSPFEQLIFSLIQVIDTNIPLWQLPRLLFALLRSALFGVDSQTTTRDMVTPFQTSAGAQVLAPNWEAINPLLKDMFRR
ncbi:MAG: hypothetical protein L0287_01840 [Anaerolineae bacterium]|nr:hypothetical protein [Anaerolineae bacterium]MCI0607469.1 hypothetical protein [Anaerolineae bacterium]